MDSGGMMFDWVDSAIGIRSPIQQLPGALFCSLYVNLISLSVAASDSAVAVHAACKQRENGCVYFWTRSRVWEWDSACKRRRSGHAEICRVSQWLLPSLCLQPHLHWETEWLHPDFFYRPWSAPFCLTQGLFGQHQNFWKLGIFPPFYLCWRIGNKILINSFAFWYMFKLFTYMIVINQWSNSSTNTSSCKIVLSSMIFYA